MRKIISQREANRLRKRVQQLEDERVNLVTSWTVDRYPGTHIASIGMDLIPAELRAIRTAQKLGFPVVVVVTGDAVNCYAVKLP